MLDDPGGLTAGTLALGERVPGGLDAGRVVVSPDAQAPTITPPTSAARTRRDLDGTTIVAPMVAGTVVDTVVGGVGRRSHPGRCTDVVRSALGGDQLRQLHGVEGGALEQVVPRHEQVEAVRVTQVLADPSHDHLVPAG